MNLKELAGHLNLSQTTVSRALNGYPEVKPATRLRVEAAARRFNYTPNARAKGLATGRAMSIGHIIPTSAKRDLVNPVFGDFITGASEAYVGAGYDLVLSLVEDGDEERVYRNIRDKGNVDGIIVHSPHMRDGRIALLSGLGLPFVVHGRASDVAVEYSWVDMNNRGAFERATGFLIELGHRRIALVNGLEFLDFAYRRREGFLAAHATRGLEADPDLMQAGEMTEQLGYESAEQMLDRAAAPTAFLTSSMVTAIGVRRAIHDSGLRMGRDVSVITHDDELAYLANGRKVPIFTATRSSVRAAGRRAAEMLLRQIADPGCGPLHDLLEAELLVGTSTAPAPGPPPDTRNITP